MNKEEIKKTYGKPEIEIMHVCIASQLLDASFPGDHHKGDHKTGPSEESSEGAKSAFFRSGGENVPASWED